MGKGSLTLPIPTSAPECFKNLLTICWNQRPANRPTFQQILKNLEISKAQIILFEQEQEYAELTRIWSAEINEHLAKLHTIDISSILQLTNEELIEKRQEELQNIADIRLLYEKRLEQVNSIYIQLKSFMMQLEQREQVIQDKEFLLNIKEKKRSSNPIQQARKKSIEIIKAATSNLNDPKHLLSHKKSISNKSQRSKGDLIINDENVQRRKKGSGHLRTNSKGSANSWAPPSLVSIENQEKRRASIHLIPNVNEEIIQRFDTSNEFHLSTISAQIDLKEKINPTDPHEDIHYSRQRRRRNMKSSGEIDSHKQSRNVTFQLSPSINHSDSKKRISYTSSEEGEAEEIHPNQDVLNDEIYRAKHAQSFGNFSSESEHHSKNDGEDLFFQSSRFHSIFRELFG